MLYCIGKDSSVMVRLAQKAFYPGEIPFPLSHVDTTYKFREMTEFRDRLTRDIGARLASTPSNRHRRRRANPFRLGTQKCCGLLKTRALLDGRRKADSMLLSGAARRDEEKSRQRAYLLVPRRLRAVGAQSQGPELWDIYNSRIDKGESIRVFSLGTVRYRT
jgi:sulfate adenylyltransferase subunit 2